MGAVIGFLSSIVSTIFGALAGRVAAKVGINAAVIGVWVAASATLAVTLTAIGSSLMDSMPSVVSSFFSVAPHNTGTCLAAIISGDAAAHIYRQLVIAASIKSRV